MNPERKNLTPRFEEEIIATSDISQMRGKMRYWIKKSKHYDYKKQTQKKGSFLQFKSQLHYKGIIFF